MIAPTNLPILQKKDEIRPLDHRNLYAFCTFLVDIPALPKK